MNLQSICAPYVSAVNAWMTVSYQQSIGYTTDANFVQQPTYAAPVPYLVQRQPMTYKDLMQVSGLNLNGEKCCFYVNGNWQGVKRPTSQGGDLITLEDGSVWLVVMILENWSVNDGWSKVACVLQSGS